MRESGLFLMSAQRGELRTWGQYWTRYCELIFFSSRMNFTDFLQSPRNIIMSRQFCIFIISEQNFWIQIWRIESWLLISCIMLNRTLKRYSCWKKKKKLIHWPWNKYSILYMQCLHVQWFPVKVMYILAVFQYSTQKLRFIIACTMKLS